VDDGEIWKVARRKARKSRSFGGLNFGVTLECLEHLIAFLGIEQNGSPDDDRR
jgi:hypothetical protein